MSPLAVRLGIFLPGPVAVCLEADLLTPLAVGLAVASAPRPWTRVFDFKASCRLVWFFPLLTFICRLTIAMSFPTQEPNELTSGCFPARLNHL